MKNLKRDYISTIVSMTDAEGKTGNVDYRDCREPSDTDLVEAAARYGLTLGIKYTVTTSVGVKTRFVADIVDGKLVRLAPETKDITVLRKAGESLFLREKEKLLQYMDMNLTSEECLRKVGVSYDEVVSKVNQKREGVWRGFSDEYVLAMFNCILTEMALSKVSNGSIQW